MGEVPRRDIFRFAGDSVGANLVFALLLPRGLQPSASQLQKGEHKVRPYGLRNWVTFFWDIVPIIIRPYTLSRRAKGSSNGRPSHPYFRHALITNSTSLSGQEAR